jgi:hypothetical protein
VSVPSHQLFDRRHLEVGGPRQRIEVSDCVVEPTLTPDIKGGGLRARHGETVELLHLFCEDGIGASDHALRRARIAPDKFDRRVVVDPLRPMESRRRKPCHRRLASGPQPGTDRSLMQRRFYPVV